MLCHDAELRSELGPVPHGLGQKFGGVLEVVVHDALVLAQVLQDNADDERHLSRLVELVALRPRRGDVPVGVLGDVRVDRLDLEVNEVGRVDVVHEAGEGLGRGGEG